MITGISSMKESKVNSTKTNYDAGNAMSKIGNFNQINDTFCSSKQISFKGNFAKIGENILGDSASKVSGKIKRFAGEAAEATGGALRKLAGKNDLPMSEKAVIAPYDSVDEKILKAAQEHMKTHPEDQAKVANEINFSETYSKGSDGSYTQAGADRINNSLGDDKVTFNGNEDIGDYTPPHSSDGPTHPSGDDCDCDCDCGDSDSDDSGSEILSSLLGG